METPTPDSLMCLTKKDFDGTRKLFGINEEQIKKSIDTIEEWCKKQPHLMAASEYLDRALIERLFICGRGSIEATKNKVEKLITYRGLMPELCSNRTLDEFKLLFEHVITVPLPRLYESEHSRVTVVKFISNKMEGFSMVDFFRYSLMIADFRLHYDYVFSERYIIDFKNINIGLLTKVNPLVIKKSQILSDIFETKIKGIHILNAPSFVDRILFLFKQTLKEKVAQRIYVHPTYEDLHKCVPKEILPKDYGGEERSCSELAGLWQDCFKQEKTRKMLENMDKLVSDESKRSSCRFNEEYMGIDGSFRRLELD